MPRRETRSTSWAPSTPSNKATARFPSVSSSPLRPVRLPSPPSPCLSLFLRLPLTISVYTTVALQSPDITITGFSIESVNITAQQGTPINIYNGTAGLPAVNFTINATATTATATAFSFVLDPSLMDPPLSTNEKRGYSLTVRIKASFLGVSGKKRLLVTYQPVGLRTLLSVSLNSSPGLRPALLLLIVLLTFILA